MVSELVILGWGIKKIVSHQGPTIPSGPFARHLCPATCLSFFNDLSGKQPADLNHLLPIYVAPLTVSWNNHQCDLTRVLLLCQTVPVPDTYGHRSDYCLQSQARRTEAHKAQSLQPLFTVKSTMSLLCPSLAAFLMPFCRFLPPSPVSGNPDAAIASPSTATHTCISQS